MLNTIVGAGAVGAASRYSSSSDQKMRLLAAPAPQHCNQYRTLDPALGEIILQSTVLCL
jgi:hypothetical protein